MIATFLLQWVTVSHRQWAICKLSSVSLFIGSRAKACTKSNKTYGRLDYLRGHDEHIHQAPSEKHVGAAHQFWAQQLLILFQIYLECKRKRWEQTHLFQCWQMSSTTSIAALWLWLPKVNFLYNLVNNLTLGYCCHRDCHSPLSSLAGLDIAGWLAWLARVN